MTAEVLRPGPVVGTGQRALALQTATLATRLSTYASVAAALFRGLSRPEVEPDRLRGQRARTRLLAELIQEIEHADESGLYETSQLIPHKLWSNVRDALEIPEDLDATLHDLLNQVDIGSYDHAAMAAQAETMRKLARRLQEVGRHETDAATDIVKDREVTPSV